MNNRCFYESSIDSFLVTPPDEILGTLSRRNTFDLQTTQRFAWIEQIQILRAQLGGLPGSLFFEFSIPRMGRRADVVLLVGSLLIILEFKVGKEKYLQEDRDQVLDYALDFKNFHAGSHQLRIAPVLVATEAPEQASSLARFPDGVYEPILANKNNLGRILHSLIDQAGEFSLSAKEWVESGYRPTPTIIEAAQALYRGHSVQEISRSDAGAHNLSVTSSEVHRIIELCRRERRKAICFVTGVPGAGKTLAGLNIANSRQSADVEASAVFLSGNGPLVDVLREALARDESARARDAGQKRSKAAALREIKSFIQNVHHFRDSTLDDLTMPPPEHVAIFDEAQRAWDREMASRFMRTKRGRPDFDQSEPEYLISVMDRHKDWAVIVCLVGSGQEIHTGEAGIAEWFRAIGTRFQQWGVYVPSLASGVGFSDEVLDLLDGISAKESTNTLHLQVSLRSYRAEKVSALVGHLLEQNEDEARRLVYEVSSTFPLALTRDVDTAKKWVREHARGTERSGVVASSKAQRLRSHAIDVRVSVDPRIWFLNPKDDVRSSTFLEDVGTEFQVQGLELDWTCLVWDGDLRLTGRKWAFHDFIGTRWNQIRDFRRQVFLKNAYRVLLTRARQGMVICVPHGNSRDATRQRAFYDGTFEYLRELGISLLA